MSVKIVAVLTARAGKAGELAALLEGMLGPSRAEPGCLRYDLWRDKANAERFVLDEIYVDNAAVASHKETTHFRDYLSKLADLAERTAFVVDAVDVTRGRYRSDVGSHPPALPEEDSQEPRIFRRPCVR